MKTSLVGMVTGAAPPLIAPTAAKARRLFGLGEAEGDEPAGSIQPEEPEAPALADAEVEAAAEAEKVEASGVAMALARAWQSGGKMDVAMRILSEPISHRDFVELIHVIGEDAGLELGTLLDELSETGEVETGRPGLRPGEDEGDFRERHAEGDQDAINWAEQ
jgi:hypothetical protein